MSPKPRCRYDVKNNKYQTFFYRVEFDPEVFFSNLYYIQNQSTKKNCLSALGHDVLIFLKLTTIVETKNYTKQVFFVENNPPKNELPNEHPFYRNSSSEKGIQSYFNSILNVSLRTPLDIFNCRRNKQCSWLQTPKGVRLK